MSGKQTVNIPGDACEKADVAVRENDELCAIFQTYNLFEYKSPGQELGMTSYDMMMGYVHLYKAYQKVDTEEAFTISFVRDGKPSKLMKELEKKMFTIRKYAGGIYHVKKYGHIDMQIVVTCELDDKYDWIKLLNDKVTEDDLVRLAGKAVKLQDSKERLAAQAVLDLIKKQNEEKGWFMREVFDMAGIRDWFQEEFDAKDKEIMELNAQLHNRDEELHSKNEELYSKDRELHSKDEELHNKNEELHSKDEQLQDRDKIISQLKQEMENLKQQLLKSTAAF